MRIISNPKKLEKLINQIKSDRFENLHILTDFDKTLTYNFVNGKEVQSVIAILRDEKYLTPDYAEKAQKLADKYIPVEDDPKIPRLKKKRLMERWWNQHFKLLINSGLSKKDLVNVVQSNKIKLREGVKGFFEILNKNNIPMIILSASGLGKDVISMILKKNKINYKNVHIVSNSFKWTKNGKAIGIKKPIIHSLNKDEAVLSKFSLYSQIQKRQNVILLGNNIEDIDMLKGLNHNNVIKVGFLNKDVEKLTNTYKKYFDMVIINDGDFKKVNQLMSELF